MTTSDALKRLGGGRWETRDGRFSIEPQSGTWVVVDATQTDDLGLPLVRGPFGSLTAAKEAIETARTQEPERSPLADRIAEAKDRPAPTRPTTAPRARGRPAARTPASPPEPEPAPAPASEPEPPPPPPEPAWILALPARRRSAARDLVARLATLGIADASDLARAELVEDRAVLARLAIERRVVSIVARTPGAQAAVDRVLDLLTDGSDDELGVRWRLVDGTGRPIPARDPGDADPA